MQGSCTELLTYSLKGANYEFELWATSASPNSYVALAISDDDKMVTMTGHLGYFNLQLQIFMVMLIVFFKILFF